MTVKRVTLGIPVDVLEWCKIHAVPMDICMEVDEADLGDGETFTYDGPAEEHDGEVIVRIAESLRYHLEAHLASDLVEMAANRKMVGKLYENANAKPPSSPNFYAESERAMSILERHLFKRDDGTWRFPDNLTPAERLLDAIFNKDFDEDDDETFERHLKLVEETPSE